MDIRKIIALALLALAQAARATDWEASLDLRLAGSDADTSYVQGGPGLVRFGQDDAVLQLGRARVALAQALTDNLKLHVDASVWDDRDAHPAGVTEAFLQWRPYPREGYRLRVKLGAFYPPVSLENRASGWESPYTLTYSAINSWLATEVRTIGTEAQLEWLGTRSGHAIDLGLTAGVFGFNDQAGTVLASDGFVFTDRQTPLGGRIGPPMQAPLFGAAPFLENDGRPGAYAGLEARYFDRLTLRVLRYDNRADPAAFDARANVLAWLTTFDSAGARLETPSGWTLIGQWLHGRTDIAPQGVRDGWPFDAGFLLLSRKLGRHTFSARYDGYRVEAEDTEQDGAQRGHALTAAWLFDVTSHWRLSLECLRVVSTISNRAEVFGLPAATAATQLQLGVRYIVGSDNPQH